VTSFRCFWIRGTGKKAVKTYGQPPQACRDAARLLQHAQVGISQGGLEGLAIETRTHNLGEFEEKRIITLGGRQKKYLWVAYNESVLPVLLSGHPLARLYLERLKGLITQGLMQ
jgi:hypothetical protein